MQGCGFVNEHGIQCGLPAAHPGAHEPNEQLIEPDPFCIRATDPFALAMIRAWISAATAHKVPAVKIQRAEEHFNEIARWQRRHGTKLPD